MATSSVKQLVGNPKDLDDRMYQLDEEEIKFLASQTGITDPEEIKKHVISVQHEAYTVVPYPCIRGFYFVKLEISRYPAYKDLLKLGKERNGALFLDIGCNAGNASRKAAADGFPAKQIIASDLVPEFWDVGHKVFKSTPESFPAKFVPGDVFDEAFLASGPLADSSATTDEAPLDIPSLTTLTPLRGRLSAIHAANFFHLFNEEQQKTLAKKLASLLLLEPGSLIFGAHAAKADAKGVYTIEMNLNTVVHVDMFCHCPESWVALWEEIFGVGKVEVKAAMSVLTMNGFKQAGSDASDYMVWSVTRL